MSLRGRFVAASSVVAVVTLSGAFTAVWFAYNAGLERQLDARDLARRMAVALFVAVVAGAVATSWLMISRLALLVETQQRFIANAAHELRSPLASLLGQLSHALRRERDAVTYRESIEEALTSARRLKVVTDDLLTLARIGAAKPELGSLSLADVIAPVVQSMREAAETREVHLEVSCDTSTVQGHAGDLERLLRNLVENAVRHSPRGGEVRIEARTDAHHIEVVVTDEGPGVPADLRERIFEPFFRTADGDEHAGAGLGLTIARGIARAHGGDVTVGVSKTGARLVVRLERASETLRNINAKG